MSNFWEKEYKLSRNPFPPSASGGVKGGTKAYIPSQWREKIKNFYEVLNSGQGPKAFPVIGEYGSGKTYLLESYLEKFFEKRNIKTFYFENPGAKFYDLANTLLRSLGRWEFSKALWELCKEYLQSPVPSLFPISFTDVLSQLRKPSDREKYVRKLASVIKNNLQLTNDDEIAYKLGLMIVETPSKPYFSYRDFVAGSPKSLVAEKEEPKYFKAIIKAIIAAYGTEGIAFLIDEFEEVAFPKRMTRKQTYEYLAVLRSLIDISEDESLWIVIAMTPEAAEETKRMNQALWQRFIGQKRTTELQLEPLTIEESIELLKWWLNRARVKDELKDWQNNIFPFPDDISHVLKRPEVRLPRALVRIGFYTLAKAEKSRTKAPIPEKFIHQIANELYPPQNSKEA